MIVIPSIETKRLNFSVPLERHLPAINDHPSKDRISFIDHPFDDMGKWRALLASLGHWHLRGFEFSHIEHRESQKMAGAVGFVHHFDWPKPELGWNVQYDFEDMGVAYDAALSAQPYWETHLNSNGVTSPNVSPNTRFAALAKRLGAAFEKIHFLGEYECHVYRHPLGEQPTKATQLETDQ